MGDEGGRCIGLTNFSLSYAFCPEILGALTSWSPTILSGPVKGLLYLDLCFSLTLNAGFYTVQ
jgi:hypothetical protein